MAPTQRLGTTLRWRHVHVPHHTTVNQTRLLLDEVRQAMAGTWKMILGRCQRPPRHLEQGGGGNHRAEAGGEVRGKQGAQKAEAFGGGSRTWGTTTRPGSRSAQPEEPNTRHGCEIWHTEQGNSTGELSGPSGANTNSKIGTASSPKTLIGETSSGNTSRGSSPRPPKGQRTPAGRTSL